MSFSRNRRSCGSSGPSPTSRLASDAASTVLKRAQNALDGGKNEPLVRVEAEFEGGNAVTMIAEQSQFDKMVSNAGVELERQSEQSER